MGEFAPSRRSHIKPSGCRGLLTHVHRAAGLLLCLALSPALASEPLTLVLNWVAGRRSRAVFLRPAARMVRAGRHRADHRFGRRLPGSDEARSPRCRHSGGGRFRFLPAHPRQHDGHDRGHGVAAALALRDLLFRRLRHRSGAGSRRQAHRRPGTGPHAQAVAAAGATKRGGGGFGRVGGPLQRRQAGCPRSGRSRRRFQPVPAQSPQLRGGARHEHARAVVARAWIHSVRPRAGREQ